MVNVYVSAPVHAEQFHIGDLPRILRDEENRALCTTRMEFERAHNILVALVLTIDGGQVVVDPGDWIVRDAAGSFSVYTHDEFTREYTQVVA